MTKTTTRRLLIAGLAALMLSGCFGSSSSSNRRLPAMYPMSSSAWLGLSQTSFGKMALVRNKKKPGQLIGLYAYKNRGRKVIGIVRAVPVKSHLIAVWSETKGGAGKGRARFAMGGDMRRFVGVWGKGKSFTNGGRWNGYKIKSKKKKRRVAPRPAPAPSLDDSSGLGGTGL